MGVEIKDLPENVKDWIFGDELGLHQGEYFSYLTPSELAKVQDLIVGVYRHDFSVTDFATKVQAAIPGIRGRQLALDVLGYDFARIQDWLPTNVEAEIVALGGDPDDYKTTRPLEDALDEAMAGVDVELIPPRTRETVMAKMTEFLNRKLDKATLLESMTKSQKIGGWGWNQDIAVPVIDKLEKRRAEGEAANAVFVHKEDIEKRTAKREALLGAAQQEVAAMPESKKNAVAPERKFVAPQPVILSGAKDQGVRDSSAAPQNDGRGDVQLPDPFALILKKNLPKANVAVAAMPDPFEALVKEIEQEQQANMPLPDPFSVMLEKMMKTEPEKVMAMAHHGTADAERPSTPFEIALHTGDLLLEHELHEIEERKDDLLKDVPESAIQVGATLDALVNRIITESGFTTDDAHLEKRVRNIISSRLRDIRSSEETAKLLAKITNGKMEMKRAMVEELVKFTEQAFLEFQRKVIERGLQRERSRRVRMREEVLEQKREDVFEAQQELNARYKKVTGKDAVMSLPMPDEQAADAAVMGGMGENPIAEMPKKRVVQTDVILSNAKNLPMEQDSSASPQNDIQKAPAPVQPVRPVKVTLSPGTVQPMQTSRPKMTDVKYERVLAGPVQELRTMRLADFRRLSKEPKLAAEKVLGKVDLLGSENYEKKVQGVIAWRESPLMALYLAVTKEALDQGTPLVNVLAAKSKTIPEMLTIEECQAIRELNAKLRY